MRAQGLRGAQMAGDGGIVFSQNMAKCNSSTTILPSMRSYGTEANAARTLSEMVWLSRSISPMCSSSEHTIRFMPFLGRIIAICYALSCYKLNSSRHGDKNLASFIVKMSAATTTSMCCLSM
eukprot:984699-Ditylum_brightwellii.AAC.1